MAIVHMAQDFDGIKGINPRIYHHDGQTFKTDSGAEYSQIIWLYDTHSGLCLHEREINGYNDSDFLMVVWNPETNQPESIEFASTRGWSYPCYASAADATPETVAKYEAWDKARQERNRLAHEDRLRRTPARGKTLKVVRGRKVPIGILGVCIWIGKGGYGERVGLKDSNGQVFWTASSNVEVVL